MDSQNRFVESTEQEEDRTSEFDSALEFVSDRLRNAESFDNLDVETIISLIILHIVDYPKDVRVNVAKGARSVIVEYDVHQDDKGKVIGRDGHTIVSFRRLARSILGDKDLDYNISVLEDKRRRGGYNQSPRPPHRNRRRGGR